MTNGITRGTNGITRGTNENGLSPCPFCGGKAVTRRGLDWYVCCTGCPATLGENPDADGNPDGEYRTMEEAAEAWNRRAVMRDSDLELVELAHSAWSMALCAMQGMPIPAEWGEFVERGLRAHGINIDGENAAFEEDEDEW